ncbi:hypothetical protein [Rosettibacter firmus]|uniref:hypothetical protein n=1 Tax=Rosettibacter firmus TaxID=3111522 RepID=UPI00336BDD5A
MTDFNSHFRLNSLESNVSNYSLSKDMELSSTFEGVIDSKLSSNLYALSFSKKLNNHYFYLRYTPGIIQRFIIKSGLNVQLPDSIAELKTEINFEEKYGLGYSWKISSSFTLGFSFRYFVQEFIEEKPVLFYTDSVNYISIKNEVTQNNYWRGDIGITYTPNRNFIITLFSNNLFLTEETLQNDLIKNYSLKRNKSLTSEILISPFQHLNLSGGFETTGSFYAGINYSKKLFNGSLTLGGLLFHDKYQQPYFAGFLSSINYSTNLFSITLSGIKYFTDRSRTSSIDKMINYGIHNITNNIYSHDRVYLTVNFALGFIKEKQVKFIDLDIKNEIYPTLHDLYLQKPIAVGKVVNLTNKKLEIRPSTLLKNVNDEIVYSPAVTILPYDTIDVPFYTFVNKTNFMKREIAQAEFYVSVDDLEPDDKIQKSILVNDKNSWDGNVSNLMYFVRDDFEFSRNYSTQILKEYNSELKSIDLNLENFYKTRILFENFIKEMNYVSDPRASVEHVQFPNETIKLKGGDCDDLSVCFASLLESIGIQTAFVDYKNEDGISHVNLLVNTNLSPEQMDLITNNDKKVVIRKNAEDKDEIWIPLETTSLKNFETAWSLAAEKFNKEALEESGLFNGKVTIIDVQ